MLKKLTENQVTAYDATDPWQAYADAVSPQHIVGKLLRFIKGDWIAGKVDLIETGHQLTANIDQLMAGWVHWVDGRPVEQQLSRLTDWHLTPRRELGDADQGTWPIGADGKPIDPWQFTNYLILLDAEGTLFTFSTSSKGGIHAIAELCKGYSKQRRMHPEEYPVVALESTSYLHSNKTYGFIKNPFLPIKDWEPKSRFDAASVGTPPKTPPSPTSAPSHKTDRGFTDGAPPKTQPASELEPPPHTKIPEFDDPIPF